MDDLSLNRAVAEARGWTPNTKMIRTAIAHAFVDEFEPPDVVSDPAAWGGLLDEISMAHPQVQLRYTYGHVNPWQAVIWKGHKMFEAVDLKPGRALALAFLASKGIST